MARSGDGESYGERPDHPLPVLRHPPRTDVEKAFDQGKEEKAPEEADYNPLGPTALWDHQPHEHGAQPDHQTRGDEHPSGPAVVVEVSRADAPHELERCEGQVDSRREPRAVLRWSGSPGIRGYRAPEGSERQKLQRR